MSFSTAVIIAAAATVVSADYTNTWWTPSSLIASSTPVQSVWTPSSSAVESVWTPSSQSVWTPSSSTVQSAWVPSSTWAKGNVSISTSYTNTVYVTKATTATTTVDCGKGTMIYGNGSAPVHTPTVGLPSGMPSDLPSEWSKSIPASVLPPQLTASGGSIMTTNCANASITYTITYTPSSSKPKKTSSSIETPSEPTEPSLPTLPPSGGEDGTGFPAPGPHSGNDDDSSSSSGSSKPSSGFSSGDEMDSAASRQDISTAGAILALGAVAVAAFML